MGVAERLHRDGWEPFDSCHRSTRTNPLEVPMNKYGAITLIAIVIGGGYILLTSPNNQQWLQQETTAATTSTPAEQVVQQAPVQSAPTATPVQVPSQPVDNPQLDQCIANQTQLYDDAFIIQSCEQSGYTKDDYEQGRCQLPFPDVNQVMIIKHSQKMQGIAACEREYSP
jgi:hypothetical protein